MAELDLEKAARLEREYDPEMHFRSSVPPAGWIVTGLLIVLSLYHYYTAGFGILAEHWHKSIHLSFVLGLVFLVFGITKKSNDVVPKNSWLKPGGIPLYDWALAGATVFLCMYIPWDYAELNFRIGNPNQTDILAGTLMIVFILEATRRAMGPVLPIIVIIFIVYAIYGRIAPGVLAHPGNRWSDFVNHVYLTTEGIFGIPVKVVSTFVFHFVLFGTIAQRMGLGQFFIDLAQCVAGRYSGGPAKVAVLSSAMFGTISGSSIANTVTTGALTIPTMKRIGYPAHFAGAVEAAASTGGQITPPIMGAAAFVMMEFLEVSYTTIMLAAIVPALMHYLGVLTIVHLEAKRLGLRGLSKEELPQLRQVLKDGWPNLIPLIVLISIIVQGYTPYMAAFWGITSCIIVGFLNPKRRLTVPALFEAFALGSKYALAVGAAAAAVGIIVGVVTITGAPFRISFMVNGAALGTAEMLFDLLSYIPFEIFTLQALTLFFSLIFIALCCIILSAGIPTTALYIITATIAAPALTQLGVPVIAAHFFVLFYGVLADITPPVCTSAYAAAGIAGSNPFKTGMTAFRLGNAKALVPLVFVYAPSLLLVVDGFTWNEFFFAASTCAIGIVCLGAALTGYLLRPMPIWQRALMTFASFFMVAPGGASDIAGLAMIAPVLVLQYIAWRKTPPPPTAKPYQAST
ncbi:MAG: TRAP transporter permease [Proteobacteria bacterium]|nr:TRAP transporter permease [Pseudomonadota bacterium]